MGAIEKFPFKRKRLLGVRVTKRNQKHATLQISVLFCPILILRFALADSRATLYVAARSRSEEIMTARSPHQNAPL